MKPPFEITPSSIRLLASIERLLGRYEGLHRPRPALFLRKSLLVRTVHGSVGIEGNTLTQDQITAVLEGHRVMGPRREIFLLRQEDCPVPTPSPLRRWFTGYRTRIVTG